MLAVMNRPRTARAGVLMIPVDEIDPNPTQPRSDFDDGALRDLAASIAEYGILNPLNVRLHYGRYELVAGERRLRAAKLAGLKAVPCTVLDVDLEGSSLLAMVENIQREDLDAIEVAISFKRLIDEVRLTQEQLSDKVGKDRSSVTNYLRLLKLPPEVQMGIRQRQIGMGHARALLAFEDAEQQVELFRRIVAGQMSVRQVEEITRESRIGRPGGPGSDKTAKIHRETSKMLSERFGTKVAVKQNAQGKGRIELAFRNAGELETLLNKLGL